MEMPLGEVIDRYTILKLKTERIDETLFNDELVAFEGAMKEFRDRSVVVKQEWIDRLYEINGRIWDLESDLRRGKEGDLGLEEVGRRAIAIRNINGERVALKNEITSLSGSGFMETKADHASA